MKKLKKVASVQIPEIDTVLTATPAESKRFVSKTVEIVDQILLILKEQGINQRALAEKLNKSEPEISKWLSGTHNFTVRTLALIESALGREIIVTPNTVQNNLFQYTTHVYRASVNVQAIPVTVTGKINTKPSGDSNYEVAA